MMYSEYGLGASVGELKSKAIAGAIRYHAYEGALILMLIRVVPRVFRLY